MPNRTLYEFGQYQIDHYQRLLFRAGVPVALGPQTFEVLRVLVQSGGLIVRRNDLIDAAWSEEETPSDGALSFHIYVLRKALGDDAKRPCFIEVKRGRGVRFISDVNLRFITPAEERD